MLPVHKLDASTWLSFSDKDRWDVMTALRGPDHANTGLKWYTTAVIRGVVAPVLRTNGTSAVVIAEPRLLLAPDAVPKFFGEFNIQHFLGHVVDAAEVLGLPIRYVDRGKWQEIVLGGGSLAIVRDTLDTPAFEALIVQHSPRR